MQMLHVKCFSVYICEGSGPGITCVILRRVSWLSLKTCTAVAFSNYSIKSSPTSIVFVTEKIKILKSELKYCCAHIHLLSYELVSELAHALAAIVIILTSSLILSHYAKE